MLGVLVLEHVPDLGWRQGFGHCEILARRPSAVFIHSGRCDLATGYSRLRS